MRVIVRMSNHNQNKSFILSSSQVMSLITSTIIGVGVLTLPRTVTEKAHQSGWISVLIGGMISLAITWMIMKLSQRFHGKNILSAGESVLGSKKNKWLGKVFAFPIAFIFMIYWILMTAGVARTFGEVVVTAVLVKTPLEVTVGTMLFVAFLMVTYDMEVMARVNEILLPIIIIPVLLIAVLSFQSAYFYRLLPLFPLDWIAVFKGVLAGVFGYQGYELMTLIMGNIQSERKEIRRAAMFGIAIPMLVYTLIVIAGTAAFGYEELKNLMWPTLELVKTTEVPGLILERIESAFLGVWVAAVFTTTANIYFAVCYLIKQLLGLKHHRYVAIVMLPALYYLAMWPRNVHLLFEYLTYASYIGFISSLGIPLFLLVIAMIRKQGEKQKGGQPS